MSTPQFDVANVLKQAQTLDISTTFQPYSRVVINVDENVSYSAGDTTGRTLTINNPLGTQAQADNILNQIRGFTYQPYEAGGALLDPAYEIGDGVSVNDVYSGLYKISRDYSSLMAADISAPQSEEIDHEYPYESQSTRNIQRKFSAMESELSVQSNAISAKVSQVGGNTNSFGWYLTDTYFQIFSGSRSVLYIDQNGAAIDGRIGATSGYIGGFGINENGNAAITYNSLSWGDTSKAGIYLGPYGIQLGNANGSFFQASSSGNVVARNMTLTGTLNIGGTNITAAALQNGASKANTWATNGTATSWTTGSGYGYNWNNAKTGYGYANDIYAGSFHSSGTSYFAYVSTYYLISYSSGKQYRPISFTLNGTTYHVFGYTG